MTTDDLLEGLRSLALHHETDLVNAAIAQIEADDMAMGIVLVEVNSLKARIEELERSRYGWEETANQATRDLRLWKERAEAAKAKLTEATTRGDGFRDELSSVSAERASTFRLNEALKAKLAEQEKVLKLHKEVERSLNKQLANIRPRAQTEIDRLKAKLAERQQR